MCGIFGAVTSKELKVSNIESIKNSLRHRGPDSAGHKSFKPVCGREINLSHTRLAIIDLSPDAAQPMSYDNDSLHIVYNGEIFNYIELKEELKTKGYVFNTHSDTEVVLASYKEWGEDCVSHFNGDWAFCVYDKLKDMLFFSRDRLGVKPLYYCQGGDNFAFSSEIKGLLQLPFIKAEWDCNIAGTFLLLGVSDFSKYTMYKGIYQLEPASNMILGLKEGKVKNYRYWNPSVNESRERFNEKKEVKYSRDIRDLLEDAVRLRLRSDVPVGTCLSGGIDSSAVAVLINVLMKKHCKDALNVGNIQKTFTVSYKQEAIDEEKWARIIIEHTGSDGRFVYPDCEDIKKDLSDFIDTHDEPCISTSAYAQFAVMKLASGCVKVVLDGQGADELFGGYDHYKKTLAKYLLSVAPKRLTYIMKYRLKHDVIERVLNGKFDIGFAMDVLKHKYPPCLNNALYNDTTRYNLQQLLKYEDRNSMRFSIESRTPFTDYRLVEYAFNIPAAYKIHNGWSKYILRKAIDGLIPSRIAWRKDKIGFYTPEKNWLLGMDDFNDFLNKFRVKDYNGEYFWWRVFNLLRISEK